MPEPMPAKPLPLIRPETAPFWEAARAGRLVFQECMACGTRQLFPRTVCRQCLATELRWAESAGRGTVLSHTTIHQAAHPAFAADLPYVYALVELDEGPRLPTNIVGVPPDAVRIGMPVRVVFTPVTTTISLPHFTPL
jgi:uncharacterized OB-fold protein